jgi:hypothetical protein
MLGHACPARACQSQRTPHLPSLLRYPRGPELHLDMPWCAWPALSPNCRGRGAVVGPVQTGDPELHVCRAQPPSPPAFKPSSERERARRVAAAAAAAAVNLAQIHLISPSCTPRPRQPRLAGLRSAECFNFTNPLTLRLGPVDRQCALFFRAWALGPSRDDPPPSEWRRMRPPPVAAHFLQPQSSSGLRPKPLAIYTSDRGLR